MLILHPLDLSVCSCKSEKAKIHTVTSVSVMGVRKVVQVSQSGRQPPWKRHKTQTFPSEGEVKDVCLGKSPVPNSGATIWVDLEGSMGTKCGSEGTCENKHLCFHCSLDSRRKLVWEASQQRQWKAEQKAEVWANSLLKGMGYSGLILWISETTDLH